MGNIGIIFRLAGVGYKLLLQLIMYGGGENFSLRTWILKTIGLDMFQRLQRHLFQRIDGAFHTVCWVVAMTAICGGLLRPNAQAHAGPVIPIRIEGKVLEQPWTLHDMVQTEDHRFQGVGPDPHIVSPELGVPIQNVEGIVLYLQGYLDKEPIPIQVFWKTDTNGFREDASFKFFIEARTQPQNIWLSFADAILPESDTERLLFIRVDWVRPGDTVGFSRMDVLPKGEAPPADVMLPVMSCAPVREIPIHDDFRRYGDYRIHDMAAEATNVWQVNGEDPYVETPELNVRLKRLKGMYVRFRISGRDNPYPFQIFWKTYADDYDEKRSFWLRTRVKDGEGAFYIPFRVLPTDDMLKTIRIDLEKCPNCRFEIVEGRLITREDSELLQQVPPNIMVALGYSVYGNGILRDILEKVRRDPGFIIVWLLLVVVVAGATGWMVWMGRGSRKAQSGIS